MAKASCSWLGLAIQVDDLMARHWLLRPLFPEQEKFQIRIAGNQLVTEQWKGSSVDIKFGFSIQLNLRWGHSVWSMWGAKSTAAKIFSSTSEQECSHHWDFDEQECSDHWELETHWDNFEEQTGQQCNSQHSYINLATIWTIDQIFWGNLGDLDY